jgi:hypothetical protein
MPEPHGLKVTLADALAPMIAEARSHIELRREITEPHPDAASEAMSERVEDVALADEWGTAPVTEAHLYSIQLLYYCEDQLECICRLLTDPDFVPLWGLLPLARALLEGAGRTFQLAEPGIGARERVVRYMNERLYGLDQISNLPAEARDSERLRSDRAEIFNSAKRKGLDRTPHPDPEKAAEGRLAEPAQIGKARLGDMAVARGLFDSIPLFGKAAYQWFAAGAHATVYEVQKPWTMVGGTGGLGPDRVLLGRDPVQVHQVLQVAMLGYSQAATRTLKFHGWNDQRWARANLNALRLSRRIAAQIAAARRGTCCDRLTAARPILDGTGGL